MSLAVHGLERAIPFDFEGLPSYTRAEVQLLNWSVRVFPAGEETEAIFRDVFRGLVERRVNTAIHLVQTSEIEQKRETREYSFEKSEILIGRNQQNDVVLPAKAIGREHARVFDRGGLLHIEDLGSPLGTWVNQKKLEPRQPYPLNNGDLIRMFPYTLSFEAKSTWEAETDVQFHASPAQPFSWGQFSKTAPAGSANLDVMLQPAGGTIRLRVDRAFLAKVISRALREQTSGALIPSDDGVIEFLLLSILERVNRKVNLPFQFSLGLPNANPAADTRGLSFHFFLGIADLAGSAQAFIPFDVLAAVRNALPAPASPPLLQQVAWPFTISAGNVEFTPDELSSLQIGDVIVFAPEGELLFPPGLRGAWPGLGWKGKIGAQPRWQFKIDSYFEERSLRMEEATKPPATEGANPAEQSPDLTQLPVRLHVVVGQVDLSLADISRMVSGTVLELDRGKTDPVHLAVNGKVLGTGELVEVEGKIGVRVTGWNEA